MPVPTKCAAEYPHMRKNEAREPALYVIPRPPAVTKTKWRREPWHTKCRPLNAKKVWLNAPVHHFLTSLGD